MRARIRSVDGHLPRLHCILIRHRACFLGTGSPTTATKKESSMTTPHGLLNDLRSSQTDLARIVEAVVRDRLPYVVVPMQAVKSWERREPDHWAKVAGWLAAENVAVVQV